MGKTYNLKEKGKSDTAGRHHWKLWSVLFLIFGAFCFQACQTEDEVNPFDEAGSTQDTVRFELTDPDPATIAGLFVNIFHPTCANSACHDGTFEPDFRTIESSYNTLVYRSPIKNDGNYTYRVHPAHPEKSVIMARLHGSISPPMPFQVDPDSDWPENQDQHIENIKSWIEAGAPDIMGNIPGEITPHARMTGVIAYQSGEKLKRTDNFGSLILNNEFDTVEIYIGLRHDEMEVVDLDYNKIAFSNGYNEFEELEKVDLKVADFPLMERGFYGEYVSYHHSVKIIPADFWTGGEQLFFRVYVQDDQNPITEIPANEGLHYFKEYMSFKWAP